MPNYHESIYSLSVMPFGRTAITSGVRCLDVPIRGAQFATDRIAPIRSDP